LPRFGRCSSTTWATRCSGVGGVEIILDFAELRGGLALPGDEFIVGERTVAGGEVLGNGFDSLVYRSVFFDL
jgi:hypothetical protein